MRTKRILCIGGAVVDIFARPDDVRFGRAQPHFDGTGAGQARPADAFHFDFGDKVRLKEVVECYGGGAANVSVGLSRLGLQTGILTLVGDDTWGERILANLKRERVDSDGISVIEGEVSPFSIILLAPNGERVVLHSAGVREHLCDPLFDRAAVAASGCVVLMHLAERRGCGILDDLLSVLEAHAGIPFMWNPGQSEIREGLRSPLIRKLIARSTVVHLNESELHSLSGEKDIRRGIQTLSQAGAVTICVTRGAEGCVAARGGDAFSCPPADVRIVDTTGAGDAFFTGFTWGSLRGEDLQTCLRAGTLNSASVIQTVGTQPGLLTDTKMQTLLRDTPLAVTPFPISS